MESEVGIIVTTVKIASGHRCSVIADHHSVGIHHGHDFEDHSFTQLFCLVASAGETF